MNITTLNISANAIKVLSVQGTVVRTQEAALPPGSIKNGLILQPEAVGAAIKSLFTTGKFSRDRVICSVNGLPFSYRLLAIPVMAPAAFNEAVMRTAKKEMSISPDEMYLAWQAYPAENSEWQVLVTGITRRPVDNLIKALSLAGVRPWLLDIPHLALSRLSPARDVIIVDFEKDCSNIVMMVDGVPRGMHMVPAISSGASLQDQVGQVTDKLAKMIDFYNGGHPVKPIKETTRVLITGELLDDEKTFGYLQPQISYPVEFLASDNKALSGWPLQKYAVNAGAGLLDAHLEKSTGKDSVPCRCINLEKIVKQNRPKTDVRKTLIKVLVPAGLVAGIGLLVVSSLSMREMKTNIDSLQADMAKANTELEQKNAAVQQAQLLQDNIDNINSRVEDIETGRQELFSSRSYMDNISSIVASMPDGLTFESLGISSREITLRGAAVDALLVIEFANNLETIGGFSQAIIYWIDKPNSADGGQKQLHFSIVISKTAG